MQSAAPGLAWRFTSYQFPLEKLSPGKYKLELAIDDRAKYVPSSARPDLRQDGGWCSAS